MPIYQWTPAISVNNPDIDSQHKRLFDLINNLHDAMIAGKGKDVLAATLAELLDYTKTHFSYEEKYIQSKQYVGFAAHKLQHDQFTKKVADWQKDFQAGKMNLTIEVSQYLKDWLVNHIEVIDKKTFAAIQK